MKVYCLISILIMFLSVHTSTFQIQMYIHIYCAYLQREHFKQTQYILYIHKG